MQFLCECRNSIGSSMVRMCSCRSRLILSIMAASVVDLPLPVGPVTRIRPRGLSHSFSTTGGRPSASKLLISNGMRRKTAPTAPRWVKMLARNRHRSLMPKEKSNLPFFLELVFLRVGHDAVGEPLGIGRR